MFGIRDCGQPLLEWLEVKVNETVDRKMKVDRRVDEVARDAQLQFTP